MHSKFKDLFLVFSFKALRIDYLQRFILRGKNSITPVKIHRCCPSG